MPRVLATFVIGDHTPMPRLFMKPMMRWIREITALGSTRERRVEQDEARLRWPGPRDFYAPAFASLSRRRRRRAQLL